MKPAQLGLLGPAPARESTRRPGDVYLSSGGFVRPLLAIIGKPAARIIECCAGAGDLVAPLRAAGHHVTTNDIDPARGCDFTGDATDPATWARLPPAEWVTSNLPFNQAIAILPHAHRHARHGVAAILRLSFLEPTEKRAGWLNQHPLTKQIVLPRYSFTGDGQTDSVTCAWMVWIHGAEPAVYIPLPDADGMPGDLIESEPPRQRALFEVG